MKNFLTLLLIVALFAPVLESADCQEPIDFDTQVKPILVKHCAGCHNDDDYEAGLSVDSFDSLEEGCDGEAVFLSGDAENSWMIQLINGDKEPLMPPDSYPRLSNEEVETLKNWIIEGANDSETEDPPPEMDPETPLTVDHDSPITAAAWSTKGVIAIGRFQTIELLDASTQKTIGILPHLGKVHSLEFSQDASKLLSAGGQVGQSGVATLWNVESQKPIQQLDAHRDAIYSATLSSDQKWIATASYDKQIKIWQIENGKLLTECRGHNDAVYDLAFSNDTKNLISASADQTIKVWSTTSGERLDTLGQPLKGQNVTTFSPDNQFIVGGGLDNRIRMWKFESRDSAKTNPLQNACFAHEAAIVQLAFTPNAKYLVSSSEDRTIKVWDPQDFRQVATYNDQPDVCAAIAISPDSQQIFVGRLDGSQDILLMDEVKDNDRVPADTAPRQVSANANAIEFSKRDESEPNNVIKSANKISVPTYVSGAIHSVGNGSDSDLFEFTAQKGEPLIIETRAARDRSKLDTKIEILDSQGQLVPRILLRAVRDSYFTFRGKNSNIADDFRIHNWQEMELNDYLYCNGEVVRLYQWPRGPDSGFLVYPGFGKRHTYFGTTATTHALHETCYVVRPFPVGTEFQPNGLPVFELNYENDDGSERKTGSDSRLHFLAPQDGKYFVRVTDARGFQGEDFKYRLEVRHARPDFKVSLQNEKTLSPGGGREFTVTVERIDGFDQAIEVELTGGPAAVRIDSPLLIEPGQLKAKGTLWLEKDHEPISDEQWNGVQVTARSTRNKQTISKTVNGFKPIEIKESPKAEFRVVSVETAESDAFDLQEPFVITIRPGESVEAKIVARRTRHQGRISFGMAEAGRNFPHGVFVDNIGLNGLMIPAGKNEQRFFLTAEKWVKPQERLFHLRANNVDGEVTLPILLRIVDQQK